MQIHLHPYTPTWPASFLAIKAELTHDLSLHRLPYTSILHIGSTAVPSLLAKPIIDILITIPPSHFQKHIILCQYRGALMHGEKQGGYRYIGDGGVKGRWSFKLGSSVATRTYPYHPPPHQYHQEEQQLIARNLYITPHDSLLHRSCLALVDTLRLPANADLLAAYAAVKMAASIDADGGMVVYENVMQYSKKKDGVVRDVLRRAGWGDGEIGEKERGVVGGWGRRRGGWEDGEEGGWGVI